MPESLTSPIRRNHPSPLVAPMRVEEGEPGRATSAFTLDPAEPLLAGHYPGFRSSLAPYPASSAANATVLVRGKSNVTTWSLGHP